jgi:hypothetical protein
LEGRSGKEDPEKHLILPLDYTLYWEGIYLGECGTSAQKKMGLKLL